MFAGRNISATHIAFASTRVMATCAAVGQGVGTAAAYAVNHNLLPTDISDNDQALSAIQQRLLRDDAFLIGQLNTDPHDLARQAQVTASSAQPHGCAEQVISGQTRAVHGEWGAPPLRANPGAHRWLSDPDEDLPAWVQLQWPEPFRPAQVQLIFDTGMHRPLTLSHSDAYVDRMVWGRPQPETVRDYTIEGRCTGHWEPLARVTDNFQRRRSHRIHMKPGCVIDALRVTVSAMNGLDHARICEIRVYAEETSRPS